MRVPAGYKVGVLTNDGVGINGTDFFAGIPEFQALDAFVDARANGFAKPTPSPTCGPRTNSRSNRRGSCSSTTSRCASTVPSGLA